MNALEIIVTVCLGVAPLLVGLFIGALLSVCYEKVRHIRAGRPFVSWFHQDYDYEEIENRQKAIFGFWSIVGATVGGFASGAFTQYCLDLIRYLT